MGLRVVRAEEAIGKTLAYDVTSVTPEYKGAILKKGKVITEDDVDILKDNGHYFVYVYDETLTPTDEVHETEAVQRLAEKMAGINTEVEPASEGKAVIYSKVKGLLLINLPLLNEINKHGVFIITTRKSGTLVNSRDTIAIVDLIPFTVSRQVLEGFLSLGDRYGKLIEVREIKPVKVGLLATGTELYEGRKRDLSYDVIMKRAETYDITITGRKIAPDDPEAIEKAILELLDISDAVIVTGGMSVDPNDYTPKVISSIADEVIAYGIPIKPNTMTIVAYRNEKPVIGVSGAVIRFVDFNILDVLLPWVASRTKITKEFLLSLANGGLTERFISKMGKDAKTC